VRDHVNDYTTLRTRLPEAPEAVTRPSCTRCGATLHSGNPGPLCSPCGRPAIVLPGWALELSSTADGVQFNALAAMLRPMFNVKVPADEPEPDAPLCACGCGRQVLRAIRSHHGKQIRTGEYLRTIYGHHKGGFCRHKGGAE
jgi:hypothetical protein